MSGVGEPELLKQDHGAVIVADGEGLDLRRRRAEDDEEESEEQEERSRHLCGNLSPAVVEGGGDINGEVKLMRSDSRLDQILEVAV